MRRAMATTVVVGLLVAGCGDDGGGAGEMSSPGTDRVTESTVGGVEANETPGSTRAIGGPGIMDLLERDSGRVEIAVTTSGGSTPIAAGVADFHDGGRTLRFDRALSLDALVDDYRVTLAERSAGLDLPAARPKLPEGDPTVQRGAVADVLASVLVPSPSPLYPADSCTTTVDDVRERLLREPPEPSWAPIDGGREEWVVSAGEVVDLPECLRDDLDTGAVRVRFVRDLSEGSLELSMDPDIYVAPRFDPVASFRIVDDRPRSEAPGEPATTVLDQASVFLLTINRCGSLPWAYNDFMAGNRYVAPDDDDYIEPGIFTSGYHCADEVPGS